MKKKAEPSTNVASTNTNVEPTKTNVYVPEHPTWEVIDSSKLSTFIECPRKYFYEYLLGWRSAEPRQALIFGEAFHAGLEVLYREGFEKLSLAQAVFEDTYRRSFDPITDDMYFPKSPANAVEALAEYATYYKNDLREYEVLHTEVSGKTTLAPGQDLYFRLDVVLRERGTGQIFVLEHKTTARGGAQWYAQWPLSIQIGTYTHALYGLLDPTSVYGVRVNGIVFLKKGTNFIRAACAMTKRQMDVWFATVSSWYSFLRADLAFLRVGQETLAKEETLSIFPIKPTSCTRWGICDYHDFCCTWPNPLHHCSTLPIGFVREYWDPREHYAERKPGATSAPSNQTHNLFT